MGGFFGATSPLLTHTHAGSRLSNIDQSMADGSGSSSIGAAQARHAAIDQAVEGEGVSQDHDTSGMPLDSPSDALDWDCQC